MAFQDDLQRYIEQANSRKEHIKGEEATKHALVVPFLQMLGWEVFDPREVQPEYTADFAKKTKYGQLEKVDYAIRKNGAPVMFIECKAVDAVLEDHEGQLSRYFNATPTVRVGILTNGVQFKAFTDLQQPNIMDPQPFINVNLSSMKAAEIEAIRKFHKVDFSSENVVSMAEEMLYYSALTAFVSQQLRDPNEAFVRFVAGEIPAFGRVTQRVVDKVHPILRKAIQSAILENIAKSFEQTPSAQVAQAPAPEPVKAEVSEEGGKVITTEFELQTCAAIESAIRAVHGDATKFAYRDSLSYLTLHQQNIRKYFARIQIQDPPFYVAFRSLTIEEIKCAGSLTVRSGGSIGESRVDLKTPEDVSSLIPDIVSAYTKELSRKED